MGDVYQQAMLNDMQAHNDVQCFNDQKYNAATGSTCCCQLVRTNRYERYGFVKISTTFLGLTPTSDMLAHTLCASLFRLESWQARYKAVPSQ